MKLSGDIALQTVLERDGPSASLGAGFQPRSLATDISAGWMGVAERMRGKEARFAGASRDALSVIHERTCRWHILINI